MSMHRAACLHGGLSVHHQRRIEAFCSLLWWK